MNFYINNIQEFIVFILITFFFVLIVGGGIELLVQLIFWIISCIR